MTETKNKNRPIFTQNFIIPSYWEIIKLAKRRKGKDKKLNELILNLQQALREDANQQYRLLKHIKCLS